MQAESNRPVKTYSIGFLETDFNEADFAADVAHHLGTDHTEVRVRPEEAQGVISQLPDFSTSRLLTPLRFLSISCRSSPGAAETVSLSGDGGDELFYGYSQVLDRFVSRSLIERPKMGSGVPIGRWLRGPLRGWADSLLEEGKLRREGYFDASQVRSKWHAHVTGREASTFDVWAVLVFESWLARRRDVSPASPTAVGVISACQ